ncbi:MAG: hypothetical protein AAF206_11530 [Bacteroidota bacterium]
MLWCTDPNGVIRFGQLGDTLIFPSATFVLHAEKSYQNQIPPGTYAFRLNTIDALITDLDATEGLLIRLQDERVAMINVYVWHQNQNFAADLANGIAKAYLDDFLQTKVKHAAAALRFVNEEVDEAEKKLELVEKAWLNFLKENDIYRTNTRIQAYDKGLSRMMLRELRTRQELIDLRHIQAAIADQDSVDSDVVYESIKDQSFRHMLSRLDFLKALQVKIAARFTEENPMRISVASQIEALHFRLEASLQQTILSRKEKLASIQASRRLLENNTKTLVGMEQQMYLMKKRIRYAEMQLTQLLEKQTEARISVIGRQSFHQLLESATPARVPLKPNRAIRIGVTGLMGIVWGSFALYLFTFLFGRVREAADLIEYVHLPLFERIGRKSLDQFRTQDVIRLGAQLFMGPEWKVVGFLDDGRKLIAPYFIPELARSMAEMGERVLIIDADPHKRHLSRVIDLDHQKGLWDMVSLRLPYEGFVQSGYYRKVDVLSIGQAQSDIPIQITNNDHFFSEINRMQQEYDRIIIMHSSLEKQDDALSLMRQCDLNFMTALLHKSGRHRLQKNRKLITQFEVAQPYILLFEDLPLILPPYNRPSGQLIKKMKDLALSLPKKWASVQKRVQILADQMLVSGSNFLIGVLITRWLGLETYGIFALGWMILLFASGVQLAFVIKPMMTFAPRKGYEERLHYESATQWLQLLCSLFMTILAALAIPFAAWLAPEWGLEQIGLALPVAIGAYLMQEFYRRFGFISDRTTTIFWMDLIAYGGSLASLVILHLSGFLSLEIIFWVFAICFSLSTIWGMFAYRLPWSSLKDSRIIFREHWIFSRWLLGTSLLQFFSSNWFILATASILGPLAVGALRMAQNLMGLTHILFQMMENVMPVQASKAFASGGLGQLKRYMLKMGVASWGIILLILTGVSLFASPLIEWVYGAEQIQHTPVLWGYCLVYAVMTPGYPLRFLLRTLNATSPIFWAYVLSTIFSWLSADYLVENYGIYGALAGLGGTQLIMLAVYIWLLKRKWAVVAEDGKA